MTTTALSPARILADRLNAVLLDNHGDPRLLLPGGGFIYCGFTGKVRLDLPGRVVVTLGRWADGPDALAEACRTAVGS